MRATTLFKQLLEGYGTATAALRVLPDFLVIGVQRAATTSLHRLLIRHPHVAPAAPSKGVHYFDTNFHKSDAWYVGHFLTSPAKYLLERRLAGPVRAGETSPYYIFHPHVPARVHRLLPEVKLVALLRDPVDRAYSHYWHERVRGFEALTSFEAAVDAEPGRLRSEQAHMEEDPSYVSFSHQHHSYLARGRYLEQLRRWHALFPRTRLLLLKSEDFLTDPGPVYRTVLRFLELPEWTPERVGRQFNVGSYPPMRSSTRQRLVSYFADQNERLYEYTGRDFGWSR